MNSYVGSDGTAGGGGGGAYGGNSFPPAFGGNGGVYGGGGGGTIDGYGFGGGGGRGGDFGGGGGNVGLVEAKGGRGGFGGGGGGGGGENYIDIYEIGVTPEGGHGGFGGGGGGAPTRRGIGGAYAGNGGRYIPIPIDLGSPGGGGGAALGGAVFVRSGNGASLDFTGTADAGAVIAGAAGASFEPYPGIGLEAPTAGQALGGAFFLPSGNSTFRGGNVTGNIAGVSGAALRKAGTGTLTLSGTNTYDGGTTVTGGVLAINSDAALGSGSLTLDGGQLRNTADVISSRGVTLGASGGTFYAAGGYLILTSLVSGEGALTHVGGLLTLTGAQTYAGATVVQGGTLKVENGSLASPSAAVSAGASLLFAGSGSYTGSITGAGALVKELGGTLTLTGNNSLFSGGITVNGGILLMGSNTALGSGPVAINGGTLDLNGRSQTTSGFSGSGGAIGFGTLISTQSGTSTFSGAVNDSQIMLNGAGTLTLAGSTDNVAGTAVVNAGVLVLGKSSSASVHAVGTAGTGLTVNTGGTARLGGSGGDQIYYRASVTLNSGGVLDLNGRSEGFNRLVGNGAVLNSAASTTATLTLGEDNGNATFSGTLMDGAGTVALSKSGTGTLTLSGSNTYNGSTVISNGTLALATSGSLRFVIGGSGTNNAVKGTGATTMDGQFAFDLSGASTNTGATWTIVANTLTTAYGTNFIVTGFQGAGGNWTNTTNGVNYVFAQSNSVLSVQSTGGVTPYNAWVSYWQGINPGFTNAAGTANPDGDPFDNNEEFAFDGNPTIGTSALLTAVKVGTNAVFNYVAQTNPSVVTYNVQSTTNLTNAWSNAVVTISNSTNQSGISQTNNYLRKEFIVPATTNSFYRVQSVILP